MRETINGIELYAELSTLLGIGIVLAIRWEIENLKENLNAFSITN